MVVVLEVTALITLEAVVVTLEVTVVTLEVTVVVLEEVAVVGLEVVEVVTIRRQTDLNPFSTADSRM